MRSSIAWLSLAFAILVAAPRVAVAAPVELEWDAPDRCPDREDVEELVSRHLGERATARASVSASGRIEQTPNGYALTLRTSTGERRIEATSCEELAQSAAVILALLIDPQAAPPEPVVEPEPEPDVEPPAVSEPEEEPAEARTVAYAGFGSVRGFARLELIGDVGLLPSLAVGPGLAGGLIWERLTIELSGMYLPAQDLIAQDAAGDRVVVGDLRMFGGRLGACYAFTSRPEFGPCFAVEYTRLVSHAARDTLIEDTAEDHTGGLWSLLLAARLWVPFSSVMGVMLELGLGLPLGGADFTVNREFTDDEELAPVVHKTSTVVGRARVGFELRF